MTQPWRPSQTVEQPLLPEVAAKPRPTFQETGSMAWGQLTAALRGIRDGRGFRCSPQCERCADLWPWYAPRREAGEEG